MEKCAGCGIETKGEHPYVGIGRANLEDNTGEIVQHPVCELCWRDPEHRVHPMKAHFHPRTHAAQGLKGAQTTDAMSKAGGDIAL